MIANTCCRADFAAKHVRPLLLNSFIGVGMLLAGIPAVHAQSYTAYSHTWVSGGQTDNHTNTAAVPAGANSTSASGHESAQSSSYAGAGYLRSISDSFAYTFVNGSSAEAGASAGFTLDDLYFTGPGSAPAFVTLHLQFDGTIDTLAATGSVSDGEADVSLAWNNSSYAGGSVSKNSSGVYSRTGLLAGYDPAQVNLLSVTLPLVSGGSNTLSLLLGTLSHASSIGSGSNASSTVHFGNTLKFAVNGPVFDLPAGWTANSVQGNIVNNQFIPPAGVPEPGTLGLVLMGAAGVWRRARNFRLGN